MTEPRRRPRWEVAWPLAGWVLLAGAFFRDEWRSGFSHLTGNDGDTRLIAFICEHWMALLHGHDGSWRDMPFFYPVKGLLGWSDAFLLYAPFYIPLREVGCGPVLALELTVIILSLVGFVSFYYLARSWFPSLPLVLVAGAGVFCFANSLYTHSASSQLFGVYLLPPIALMARRALGERGTVRVRVGLAALTGLLAGLVVLTTYYVAVFTAIALGATVVWAVVVAAVAGRSRLLANLDGWRSRAPAAAAAAAGLAVGLVPGALTYLPVRSDLPGPSSALVTGYSISWRSLINVGSGNVLWSHLEAKLSGSAAPSAYEGTYGMTPVLFALLLGGIVWLAWRVRRAPSPRAVAGLATGLAGLTLALLPVRFGSRPPWLLLRVIPGLSAIRAIDRIQIVAGALAVLTLLAVASEVWSPSPGVSASDGSSGAGRQRLLRSLVALAFAAVLVEQYNRSPTAQISRAAEDRLLASVRPAPPGCRYFFVVDSALPPSLDGSAIEGIFLQIDAMFAARAAGLPTLNGYTGYDPKGWQLGLPGDPDYLAAVAAWENQEQLGQGACRLDLATMSWAAA